MLAYWLESSTPTWVKPECAARVAVVFAADRPVVFGYETRTIVHPLRFGGQPYSPFFGPAGFGLRTVEVPGSGALGSVEVSTVGGAVVVGRTGSRAGGVAGAGGAAEE